MNSYVATFRECPSRKARPPEVDLIVRAEDNTVAADFAWRLGLSLKLEFVRVTERHTEEETT